MKKLILITIVIFAGISAYGQTYARKGLSVGASNNVIDSIVKDDGYIKHYADGGGQLTPHVPDTSQATLESALIELDSYTAVYEPWKLIYPETDVVAKPFGTPMVTSTTNNITGSDGRMYLALYRVTEQISVTGARALAAGSSAIAHTNGDNYNGFVIYQDMGNDTAVLVDSTVNDSIIWKAATGTIATGVFTATVTLEPGWYYIGTLANHSEAPPANCSLTGWTSAYNTIQTLYGLATSRKYRLYISSLAAPPASFKISGSTNGTFTSDILLYYTPE